MPVDFGFACQIAAARPADGRLPTLVADHLQIHDNPLIECWMMLCTYAAELREFVDLGVSHFMVHFTGGI